MIECYHYSAYGDYGRDLPRDLDGYVHLTAAGWLAAPMDTAGEPMTEEQAAELAEQAAAATREAEAGIAAWRRQST
jgi:hypothetical protein